MSRRSPKLQGKSEAIVALLKYVKQQSKMTLLELEYKFTPRQSSIDGNDNHGGREWWRWINRDVQPEIELVTALFKFASDQLIKGEWQENGTESQWTPLLSAVIDPIFSFVIEKKSTLLRIFEQLDGTEFPEQSRNPHVTNKMLQAISTGYYVPTAEEMREIFWSKPNELDDCYRDNEYVPWYRIWPANEVERNEMELLMTDILANLGIQAEDRNAIEEFARQYGFVGNDLGTWSDQVHQQIKLDAELLSNISERAQYIYPNEFKWADFSDNDSQKIATQKYIKMQDELMIIAAKFKKYSETIKSTSKPSRMYGLFSRLSHRHFVLNDYNCRIGWDFPAIDIM